MAEVQKQIDISIVPSGAITGANKVNAALDSITRKGKATSAANDNLAGSFDKIGKSATGVSKVGTVLDEIKNRAAGATPMVGNLLSKLMAFGPQGVIVAGVALAIAAIGTAAIKAANQVEVWKANILTMTKDTKSADSAYRALVDFAAKTPFSLEQSVKGFTKLRGLGLETSTAIMTSYGNTAAATGNSMKQMIEAVADASTFQFERLLEFGIKAQTEGNKVKLTFQGTTTTVEKNAAAIQKYLVDIGNNNFGGAMARQAATGIGGLSALSDQIFTTLAAMGDGNLGKAVGKVVGWITDGILAITPLLSGIMDVIGGILSAAVDVGSGLLSMFTYGESGATGLKAVLDTLAVTFSFIGESIGVVGSVFGSVFGLIGDVAGATVSFIGSSFGSVFSWLKPAASETGQSMSESIVGVLRAAQFVAAQLPNVFKIALAELKIAFIQTGEAISKSLTGDFSGWSKVDLSFSRTKKGFGQLLGAAGSIQQDKKGNRAWLNNAAGRNGDGSMDFDAAGKNKPTPDKPDKKSGESEAEKRLKQEKEFWDTLKGELETAKLLPLAAADHAKELELQKILGRDLLATEKERLGNELQQVRNAQFLTSALDDHNKKSLELSQQEELFGKQLKGMTDEQATVEKAVYTFRNEALAKGVDLQSEAYKIAEAQARADAARGVAIDSNNEKLKQGLDVAKKYSETAARNEEAKGFSTEREKLDFAYAGGQGTMTKKVYDEAVEGLDRAVKSSAATLKDEFGQRITELGEQFGGAFGKAISKIGSLISSMANAAKGDFSGLGPVGGILNLFGKGANGLPNKLGKAAGDSVSKNMDSLLSGKAFADPLKSLSTGFGDFKGDLKQMFGKGGDFTKGLGSILGNAGMGASMGGTVAGLVGGDSTGGQIGGALGAVALGPLGGIVGGLLGGLVGNLFKKTPTGSAVITGTGAGDMSVNGNKQSVRDNLNTLGTSVQSGVQGVADMFGAMIGDFNVSVGQRGDYYRVSKSGSTAVGNKTYPDRMRSDVLYDGKDAEQAIKIAIADAVGDGALVGVSDFTKRIISNDPNLDRAASIAKQYEDILTSLTAFKDPIKGAVDASIKAIDNLIASMKKSGATTEELGKVEEWRAIKLDEVLKQQMSSFQSILDQLDGEAGGFTGMSLLNKNLAEMERFKAEIAAGKTVDQEDFSEVMSKVINGVNDIYGANSAAGQDILSTVRSLTNSAMDLTKSAFTQATNPANNTASMMQEQVNQQQQSNDYLAQMVALIREGLYGDKPSTTVGNVNGKVVYAY